MLIVKEGKNSVRQYLPVLLITLIIRLSRNEFIRFLYFNKNIYFHTVIASNILVFPMRKQKILLWEI